VARREAVPSPGWRLCAVSPCRCPALKAPMTRPRADRTRPAHRYRVALDAEGWPMIPGRYGRLE
jgi:hypothetical protein